MVRLIRIRFSGAFGRAITTATVAASSDSSTKKWVAWNPGSSTVLSATGFLVEVAELIVQPRVQRVLCCDRRRSILSRVVVATRPAEGDHADERRSGRARDIRQRP